MRRSRPARSRSPALAVRRTPRLTNPAAAWEPSMTGLWPWLAVAGLDALHALNPATGWALAAAWAYGRATPLWHFRPCCRSRWAHHVYRAGGRRGDARIPAGARRAALGGSGIAHLGRSASFPVEPRSRAAPGAAGTRCSCYFLCSCASATASAPAGKWSRSESSFAARHTTSATSVARVTDSS